MTKRRSVASAVGAAENSLRALLNQTLRSTAIGDYRSWVALNALDSPAAEDEWPAALQDVLKLPASEADELVRDLAAQGLIALPGSLTPRGERELADARRQVSAVTSHLLDGVDHHDQNVVIHVLDHVRAGADKLLSSEAS